MSRALDFFCRECLTSVVVIDAQWAQVQAAGEEAPRYVPAAHCRRVQGTEPLAPARGTGALDKCAS
jgi:hypothetical protein